MFETFKIYGNNFLKIFKKSEANSIETFMRKVIFGTILIFIVTPPLFYIIDPLVWYFAQGIHYYFSFGAYILSYFLSVPLLIATLYAIKKNSFKAALFLAFCCLLVNSIIFGNVLSTGRYLFSIIQFMHKDPFYKIHFFQIYPFLIILIFLIIKFLAFVFGYSTQNKLSLLGKIAYRILLIIAAISTLIFFLTFIFEYFGEFYVPLIATALLTIPLKFFSILFPLFIVYDTHKIKNIGLEAIKKDDANLKCSILLCALVLYLDFTSSWMRVLIPWGWKKE